jgi:hypothetical protein
MKEAEMNVKIRRKGALKMKEKRNKIEKNEMRERYT